jgi:hypothetical protein
MKQTLTKENFWDGMTVRFPKAMKLFGQWIDNYKMSVDWPRLFNSRSQDMGIAPKFHQLPYAMQQGIWIEFAKDIFDKLPVKSEYNYRKDLVEDVQETFEWIEPLLNESKQKQHEEDNS